jgi:hypothetical protein
MQDKYDMSNIVPYLDDFLIASNIREECIGTSTCLMCLLHLLDFWINYNKVEGPSQRLVFLGILLDTVDMWLELPLDKTKNIKDITGSALKLNYKDTFNGKVDMVDSRTVNLVFIDSCQIAV